MKSFLSILVLWLSFFMVPANANMASPAPGNPAHHPFISKHVDILHEAIRIIPDPNLSSSKLVVEYQIQSEKSEKQIPFLFYAYDFKGNFHITIDGTTIALEDVPEKYNDLDGMVVDDFDFLFAGIPVEKRKTKNQIGPYGIDLKDLKFFSVDLKEGKHTITATYDVIHDVDGIDLLHEYNMNYILSPANHWKSFGGLDVIVDMSNINATATSNLGESPKIGPNNEYTWHTGKLYDMTLNVTFHPNLSIWAYPFTLIGLIIISLIYYASFLIYHVLLLRKQNTNMRRFALGFLGICLFPLLKSGILGSIYYILVSVLSHANENILFTSILELYFLEYMLPAYTILLLTVYAVMHAFRPTHTKNHR